MSELKSKHAFGSESGISAAIAAGKIDAYDILFLSEGKIGWLDKNGTPVILDNKEQVIKVDTLPTADGDESVIYLYNYEAYVWDGTQCVPIGKSADLTTLEQQVSNLETQVSNKVDASEVQTMVDTAVSTAVEEAVASEVVEF